MRQKSLQSQCQNTHVNSCIVHEGMPRSGVIPLDVAFHLRHSLCPLTVTATVATPFAIPYLHHHLRTDFVHHSYTRVHLALYSLDHTACGRLDRHLNLGLDLHNFRGHAVAGGRYLARITDAHREYQLARHLALSPVLQKVRECFWDSLGML